MRRLANLMAICVVALRVGTGAVMAASDEGAQVGLWQKRVRLIAARLDEAAAALAKGDKAEARRLTDVAYFEIFENPEQNMEVEIRMEFGRNRMYEIEWQFRNLWRGLNMESDVAPEEFRRSVAAFLNDLRNIAIELDGGVVLPAEKHPESTAVAPAVTPVWAGFWKLALIVAGIAAIAAFLIWRRKGAKPT